MNASAATGSVTTEANTTPNGKALRQLQLRLRLQLSSGSLIMQIAVSPSVGSLLVQPSVLPTFVSMLMKMAISSSLAIFAIFGLVGPSRPQLESLGEPLKGL